MVTPFAGNADNAQLPQVARKCRLRDEVAASFEGSAKTFLASDRGGLDEGDDLELSTRLVRALHEFPGLGEPPALIVQQGGIVQADEVQGTGLDLVEKFARAFRSCF